VPHAGPRSPVAGAASTCTRCRPSAAR
jgi:hypothetical protein